MKKTGYLQIIFTACFLTFILPPLSSYAGGGLTLRRTTTSPGAVSTGNISGGYVNNTSNTTGTTGLMTVAGAPTGAFAASAISSTSMTASETTNSSATAPVASVIATRTARRYSKSLSATTSSSPPASLTSIAPSIGSVSGSSTPSSIINSSPAPNSGADSVADAKQSTQTPSFSNSQVSSQNNVSENNDNNSGGNENENNADGNPSSSGYVVTAVTVPEDMQDNPDRYAGEVKGDYPKGTVITVVYDAAGKAVLLIKVPKDQWHGSLACGPCFYFDSVSNLDFASNSGQWYKFDKEKGWVSIENPDNPNLAQYNGAPPALPALPLPSSASNSSGSSSASSNNSNSSSSASNSSGSSSASSNNSNNSSSASNSSGSSSASSNNSNNSSSASNSSDSSSATITPAESYTAIGGTDHGAAPLNLQNPANPVVVVQTGPQNSLQAQGTTPSKEIQPVTPVSSLAGTPLPSKPSIVTPPSPDTASNPVAPSPSSPPASVPASSSAPNPSPNASAPSQASSSSNSQPSSTPQSQTQVQKTPPPSTSVALSSSNTGSGSTGLVGGGPGFIGDISLSMGSGGKSSGGNDGSVSSGSSASARGFVDLSSQKPNLGGLDCGMVSETSFPAVPQSLTTQKSTELISRALRTTALVLETLGTCGVPSIAQRVQNTSVALFYYLPYLNDLERQSSNIAQRIGAEAPTSESIREAIQLLNKFRKEDIMGFQQDMSLSLDGRDREVIVSRAKVMQNTIQSLENGLTQFADTIDNHTLQSSL